MNRIGKCTWFVFPLALVLSSVGCSSVCDSFCEQSCQKRQECNDPLYLLIFNDQTDCVRSCVDVSEQLTENEEQAKEWCEAQSVRLESMTCSDLCGAEPCS